LHKLIIRGNEIIADKIDHGVARCDDRINLFPSNTADMMDFEYNVISHSKLHDQSIIELIIIYACCVI